MKVAISVTTGSKAYVCDIADLDGLVATVETVSREMGHPSVLIHNAVSATFNTFLEADPLDLEKNFRVNTTSLLYLARALAPKMIEKGNGGARCGSSFPTIANFRRSVFSRSGSRARDEQPFGSLRLLGARPGARHLATEVSASESVMLKICSRATLPYRDSA